MFGYVRPERSELLVREYEFYRATYCGICRAMKKYTGVLSNVSLSYDSVLLALVRMNFVEKDGIRAVRRRCIAHPVKPRGMLADNEAIEYTARAFALFTYYKVRDDISDGNFARRAAMRLALPVTSAAKRRSGLSGLSALMREKLDKITECEKKRTESVDVPAELFGELLGEVFSHKLSGSDKTVYYSFGYHLGKFIYAADAAEDYERDFKSGSYNPYALIYKTPVLSYENKQNIKCALLLECKKIEAAFNLMPFGNRATLENIVKNIIYLGLPARIAFLDKTASETEEKERFEN